MTAPIPPAERYLPIGQHAVIGDRRTAALVGSDGTIDWMCLPNFDGDVVFGALLDADRGGYWKIGPQSPMSGMQEYIDGTAVVQTSWETEDWQLELIDAMLWPDRGESDPRAERRVVLRRLRCLRGEAPCVMELAPRHMFGGASALKDMTGWHTQPSDNHWLGFWVSDPVIGDQIREDARAVFRLSEGQSIWMILGDREEPADWSTGHAEVALDETIASWSNWIKGHPFFGPRRAAVLRSVRAGGIAYLFAARENRR
jgi:hypothetical protein